MNGHDAANVVWPPTPDLQAPAAVDANRPLIAGAQRRVRRRSCFGAGDRTL